MKNKSILPDKQNKLEKTSAKLLEKYFPGKFEYLEGYKKSIGGYYPDFISKNGKKKIIEILGCYWHNCWVCNQGDRKDQDKEKMDLSIKSATYAMDGYDSLFIWEHEMKDLDKLVIKIKEFVLK